MKYKLKVYHKTDVIDLAWKTTAAKLKDTCEKNHGFLREVQKLQ